MTTHLTRPTILRLLAVQYLVLLALVAGWAWWRGKALSDRLDLAWSPLLLGLLAGALLPLITFLLTRRFPSLDRAVRWLQDEVIGPLRLTDAPAIAVASGVVEELFFRWLLQDELGWLGANLVFGAFHFVGRGMAAYAVWAFAVGLGLSGLMAGAGGNLLVPIAAHALNNLVAIAATKVSQRSEGPC